MAYPLVIKVKYGETLRRFNALVLSETCELVLGMDGLRAKICSLFNFPSNAGLKTTYIDEDGDVVTLVDDDDLCDAIRQRMKILRIDVELRGENNKHPYKPGQFEQKSRFLNDSLWVDNGEDSSSLEAYLIVKLHKNDKELFSRHSGQRVPATPAAANSTESHPVVGDRILSAALSLLRYLKTVPVA